MQNARFSVTKRTAAGTQLLYAWVDPICGILGRQKCRLCNRNIPAGSARWASGVCASDGNLPTPIRLVRSVIHGGPWYVFRNGITAMCIRRNSNLLSNRDAFSFDSRPATASIPVGKILERPGINMNRRQIRIRTHAWMLPIEQDTP